MPQGMIQQQGTVLITSMIVMSILLISSLALLRSTETANLIAGNLAFKHANTAAADIGVQLAIADLMGVVNKETHIPNRYFATQQTLDQNGIPVTANWQAIPETQVGNHRIQMITERLCTGPLPISDFNVQCSTGPDSTGSSNKAGSQVITANARYYRVTVRATGPSGSVTFIQAILRES